MKSLRNRFFNIFVAGPTIVLVAASFFCCCFFSPASAQEPVPACHRSADADDAGHDQQGHEDGECACPSVISVSTAKADAGMVLKEGWPVFPSIMALFKESLPEPAGLRTFPESPPYFSFQIPLYFKHSNLRL